ncbi:MAG TPA: hypothetical protein VJZ71_06655 [Phycisphaerae bacterium]|nr:hypothetical protein [Phycisphaerae bacterium]
MAEASDYRLDVVSSAEEASVESDARPWIGIHFECCGVYARVYRRREERQYLGRCPSCGRALRVLVRADGVKAKVFRARPA